MAEQSPSLSSQLEAVARELDAIHFDVMTILSNLQLNKIIDPNEADKIKRKDTRSERLVELFHEILPQKQIKTIARMYLTLKVKKASTLLKVLEEKLGVLDEFRAQIQSSEEVKQQQLLQNPMSQHPVVLRLKEELKRLFNHSTFKDIRPIPTLPDFSFPIDDIWVDLQIEKPEMKSWHPVAEKDFSSLIHEILEDPVVVLGVPGIGKSTLWKWMCRQWAFGRFSTEFDLILPCRLRDIGKCDTILELALSWLEQVLPDKRCVDDFRRCGLLQELHVLVLLDGMDQYSGTCMELDLIFSRTKALGFSLLITSRPMRIMFGDVKWNFLRIAGLNFRNIQLYIAKAFKIDLKDIGHHSGASKVVEAIRLRSDLREMARIPLLLSYFCLNPTTLEADTTTEVYIELMHFLMATHNRKTLKEDVFSTSDKRLWELGKLAFNGLLAKSEQLVFDETQLTHIDKLFFDAGFLVRETTAELQILTKANFPHKTVQEFLAAVGMVQSMEIGRKSLIARLMAKLNYWKIISSLIESSDEERVLEAEFPARLEQTIKFFIGITSNPSYPHAISAHKFLKAYLASTEVPPFVLTSYLKESKSIAFSEIITSHLHKKDITFIGSPLNMASFIQDAPDLNLSSFMWIINESFDQDSDLLNFKPKTSAKLKFKSFEVRIELKPFERYLQQYLTDFVKLYFPSIVTDKMVISSRNSDTTLDIHLYQAFSALSTASSCELVNIENMENICNHSLKGMALFLQNVNLSQPLTSIVWNNGSADFNPEPLSFYTRKASLELKYLQLNFLNNGLDSFSYPADEQLFKVATELLRHRQILWDLHKLRITNISEANTNSLVLRYGKNETELRINFQDESVWNKLSGLLDLILKNFQILCLGYSAFSIAIAIDIEELLHWVFKSPERTGKYLEWVLNDPRRALDYMKWLLRNPQRKQDCMEWLKSDRLRRQVSIEWNPSKEQDYVDYVEWMLNDPRTKEDHLEWLLNDPQRKWNYIEWVFEKPETQNREVRAQDHLEWVLNDTRRTQDFVNSIRTDLQLTQYDSGNDLLMVQDSKCWKAISIFVHQRSYPPVIGIRLPKEEFGNAIAFVNHIITDLTLPLKDPLRCTFNGEGIEGPDGIPERCADLSTLDFIIVIKTYSEYSEAILHVLDILS